MKILRIVKLTSAISGFTIGAYALTAQTIQQLYILPVLVLAEGVYSIISAADKARQDAAIDTECARRLADDLAKERSQ